LLDELADATIDGSRKEFMEWLVSLPLLILDDLGMRKLPLTAAEDLLEIIMRRYWPRRETAALWKPWKTNCMFSTVPTASAAGHRYDEEDEKRLGQGLIKFGVDRIMWEA